MIKLSFNIINPRRAENFKSLYERTWHIRGNKYFEVQATRYKWYWFELEIDTCWRGSDHAGPSLQIGMFGYNIMFNIYDSRHWDYVNNTWVKYEDTL